MTPYVTEEERALVIEKWGNFRRRLWTRSGVIEDVPEDIVNRLIAGCSSAGGFDAIDAQIERFRVFERAGLTELAIRLFDDPLDALKARRGARAALVRDVLTPRVAAGRATVSRRARR